MHVNVSGGSCFVRVCVCVHVCLCGNTHDIHRHVNITQNAFLTTNAYTPMKTRTTRIDKHAHAHRQKHKKDAHKHTHTHRQNSRREKQSNQGPYRMTTLFSHFHRQEPYAKFPSTTVAVKVVQKELRLEIPKNSSLPELQMLQQQCMNWSADDRPDFKQILEKLRSM